MTSSIALVCLDVDGTLTEGVNGPDIPGARAAVTAIRQRAPVRFVTNSTSCTHRSLAKHLRELDMLEDPLELVTPSQTARRVLTQRGAASGLLLIESTAAEDFDWFEERPDGPTVLLGTEAHSLCVRDLQPAFRRLLAGAKLYTLQRNRYFRREGELVTDLGPVVAFLCYASGQPLEQVVTLGKPSPLLFDALAEELGAGREQIVMVGDDAEIDVAASVSLGMLGVLIRAGKYQPGDEERVSPSPTAVLDSIGELPAWLEGRC